jgi:RimJ/RimL family protein N-acetyltransferase
VTAISGAGPAEGTGPPGGVDPWDAIAPVVPAGRMRDRGQPTLRADGLVLRPWTREDVDVVLRAFADPAIQRWNMEALSTREVAYAWIDQWAVGWAAERVASWAVTDPAGQVLGRVAVRGISLQLGVGECAYWTLPAARGRGVAVAALELATRWAFELGLHRLELQHSVRNPASCRVALRAGFALEGVHRDGVLHADGWHDMHFHGRVAGDREGRSAIGEATAQSAA